MNMSRFILCISLLVIALLSSGCANGKQQEPVAPEIPWQESTDSSCSYFYFLWGSNAEYDERYDEALEAYEKASICDPDADYIAEKIPVLLIQLGRLEEAAAWLEKYIAGRPDKTVQRFILARLRILEGKEDEAIQIYREALEVEPDNANIQLRLGLLHGKKGEFEVAENIFKAILEKDRNSYFALLYLARLYTENNELDKAEQRYLEALQLNWSKELSYEIADFYNLRKQFDKARQVYEDVLKKDERDEGAALGMVQTYLFLEEAEAALEELTRLRQFSNNPDKIDLVRSQILINLGENEAAKKILTFLVKEKALSQANYLLGVILYDESDFEEAIKVLQRVEPGAPEYRDSIMLQVRILEESDKSEQSIKLLQNALEDEQTRLPSFYSWLASIYQQHDNMEKALETLAEGIVVYENDESLLYEYGILQEKTGNHELAMQLMEKILVLNHNHADALNFIGYSWADDNINLQKAYEYIGRALELKPDSGYILDSMGWVYYRLGAFDKAETELLKAAELEPEDPYIYEHLGDTYRALNDKEKALHYYRKSLEYLTDDQKSTTIQNKINTLDDHS
ncbi:tetratricopeptide repeat protein [Desulfopila inferna]|uniref:tetratricopeptide repeat protein n=1 Tax=Desulfopila inferna TaxID=468528 RepID=UPI001962972C|nr:tetratricopeptide repeat protein [Desulfopila inferna]MBM9604316.1 tetratricopeptide repeat protein [Desulfopila inferna]